jgi:predicted DNA-binding protein
MSEPDPETAERLHNLAAVGKALNNTYSADNMDMGDDFYMALDSLNKFKEGLDKLSLDVPTREGMNGLVEYLRKKIQRRLDFNDSKS